MSTQALAEADERVVQAVDLALEYGHTERLAHTSKVFGYAGKLAAAGLVYAALRNGLDAIDIPSLTVGAGTGITATLAPRFLSRAADERLAELNQVLPESNQLSR